MELLERFVDDMNLKPSDCIFKHGYTWHLKQLRSAGKNAGLKKKISTHILKHTFVTQAHRHGVNGDTISDQCGTELRCLVKFYRANDESRLRHEMQGTTYNFKPFHEWINELSYHSRARYRELKNEFIAKRAGLTLVYKTLQTTCETMCPSTLGDESLPYPAL